MFQHALTLFAALCLAAPLPTKKLPPEILNNVEEFDIQDARALLSKAKLIERAKQQGLSPVHKSASTIATLTASSPRKKGSWLDARCVSLMTSQTKVDGFTFLRDQVQWCRSNNRLPGVVVNVAVKAGKMYAVNCSGTSHPWTITRGVGPSSEVKKTQGGSPMLAFTAKKDGVQKVRFSFDDATFQTEYTVDSCRVSQL